MPSDPEVKAIEVAAGLVFRAGKLLITQRYDDAHLGGLWEFPGGKVELGESFEECLARELAEELGIRVRVGPLIESLTHSYPEKTVHLRFFRCEWQEGEPQPLGCNALAWVEPQGLSQYSFPAADAKLLGRLTGDRALWNPSPIRSPSGQERQGRRPRLRCSQSRPR